MNLHKLTPIVFLLIGMSFLNSTLAADTTQQEKCYVDLKNTISQLSDYATPFGELQEKDYDFISKNLSKNYKNISSFGIDTDDANFSMKVYTFWEQTAYRHPPYSPYPAAQKNETWEKLAKEYVFAEEYVLGADNKDIFLGCSLMHIDSQKPMTVKADKYWYDGTILSVVVSDDEHQNKIWYNYNTAYDFDFQPLANFERLFVFPKGTQNTYFDKYDIIDAFPGGKTDLKNFVFEMNGGGKEIAGKWMNYDRVGNITALYGFPSFLKIPEFTGKNKDFTLYDFYQEIENVFPAFAKHLSLRGALSFDTAKKILEDGTNPRYAEIINTTINPFDFIKYAKAKELWKNNIFDDVTSAFYEEQLQNIGTLEQHALTILAPEVMEDTGESLSSNPPSEIQKVSTPDFDGKKQMMIIIAFLVFLGIIGIFIVKNKK